MKNEIGKIRRKNIINPEDVFPRLTDEDSNEKLSVFCIFSTPPLRNTAGCIMMHLFSVVKDLAAANKLSSNEMVYFK